LDSRKLCTDESKQQDGSRPNYPQKNLKTVRACLDLFLVRRPTAWRVASDRMSHEDVIVAKPCLF